MMNAADDLHIFFPGGYKDDSTAALFKALKLAGILVTETLHTSRYPDAAITCFHGRARVPENIHTILKELTCPVIGIELQEPGNRNDPIAILDLELGWDTPFAVIAHAIRKQVSLSGTLTSLKQTEETVARHRRRLDDVVELGVQLTRTLSQHELYQLVVERAAQFIQDDIHMLFTMDEGQGSCCLRAIKQPPGKIRQKVLPSFRLTKDTRDAFLKLPKPLYVKAPVKSPQWLIPLIPHFGSASAYLITPFVSKDHFLGFMVSAAQNERQDYSPSQIERMEVLASFSSVAMTNAFVYDQTETLSRIDDLTGVYNFGYIQNFLDRLISAAESFSMIFIDLDGFKKINLLYGHTAGNKALRDAAAKIKQSLAASSLCGRFGGDEFVVVIPGDEAEAAELITKKIISSIETIVIDADVNLSGSAGIAVFPTDGQNLNAIIHAADTAMYAAKERGRGHVVQFRNFS